MYASVTGGEDDDEEDGDEDENDEARAAKKKQRKNDAIAKKFAKIAEEDAVKWANMSAEPEPIDEVGSPPPLPSLAMLFASSSVPACPALHA